MDVSEYRKLARLLYKAHRTIDEMADLLERNPIPDFPAVDMTFRESTSLSVRARKACMKLGCKTLRELSKKRESDVIEINTAGVVTLDELRKELAKHGLTFQQEGGEQ